MSTYLKEYKTFFESPAGLYFLKELDRQIEAAHTSAESNPEKARDYTQHAKGVRNVIAHIKSAVTEPKKVRP